MFAPRFLDPDEPSTHESYSQAVEETDAVISVSECTKDQFATVYGYNGPVHTVRYHNIPIFDEPIALPDGPPWKIGYMGRLDIKQKNLDTLLRAFHRLQETGAPVELHFYGGGNDQAELESLTESLRITSVVTFHGRYDHRTDIPDIVAATHLFTYTSNYEGGPCFTLLELLQAGRYVVAAPVGGIPDLYDGYPEVGLLVDEQTVEGIYQGLRDAIERVEAGQLDPNVIRRRYDNEFDMEAAHDAWMALLSHESSSTLIPNPNGSVGVTS
jgi:glycosyltransferase involved in cell wall biosynthesis